MSRTLKLILFTVGGALGLLALIVLVAPPLVANRYRPRLEAAASEALGMDVRVGRLGLSLFPGFHVTVEDAHVFGEQGASVASAKRLGLWIALVPLLHGELRLRRIEL